MILLENPMPVTLDLGVEKFSGFVMQLTARGIMVELDKIPFKVGTVMLASIQLNSSATITEKVRSIKHYDKFFRNAPHKLKEGEAPPIPKMLCELHFQLLSEQSRVAISKFAKKSGAES